MSEEWARRVMGGVAAGAGGGAAPCIDLGMIAPETTPAAPDELPDISPETTPEPAPATELMAPVARFGEEPPLGLSSGGT